MAYRGADMKTKLIILLTTVLLIGLPAAASAAGSARVDCPALDTKPGQSIVIPVAISGNPGLMGFKLQFDYPAGVFKSPAAHRGAVTASGSFNDSINDQTNGSFVVLWNDSKNVTADGPLCVLDFKVSERAAPGEYTIKISASQPDTFNEKWEDVALDCRAISVRVSGEASTTVTTSTPATTALVIEQTTASVVTTTFQQTGQTTSTAQTSTPSGQGLNLKGIDSEYLVSAVEGALEQIGVESIGLLTSAQKQEFIQLVMAKLNAYGAGAVGEPGQSVAQTVKQLEAAYMEAKAGLYVDTVLKTVDGDKIIAAVEEAMRELGAESMDELTGEQRKKFIEDVAGKIQGYQPKEKANLDGLSEDEVFEAVSDLYEQAKNEQDHPAKQNSRLPVIIGISVGAILLAGGAVLFINRKRKMNMSDGREKGI